MRTWIKHQRPVLFTIKLVNLALITIYQFFLIYVLTRTVGPEIYPVIVLIASVGNYILSADLGFSGYVYAHVRERFVLGTMADVKKFIVSSLNFYFLIPVVAFIGAALVIPIVSDWPPLTVVGLIIYFASIIFSLPWQMIRSIMLAIDAFLLMEAIEFFRRLLLVILAIAMLAGLPFPYFAAACLLTWVLAFGAAFAALHHHGILVFLMAPKQLLSFVLLHRGKVARTGSFGMMEFTFYNFPYILIPALGLGGNALIFFDLFFKVTRFCGIAYSVPIETLLPYQTRAWYEGRKDEVRHIRSKMILLCLPIFLIASALLLLFGELFFNLLLHNLYAISFEIIYMMIAMMFLILLQCTTGTFLVGIGKYETLVKISTVALGLSCMIALASFIFHFDIIQMLFIYVASYGVYAGIYRLAFKNLLRGKKIGFLC
jgi:O-antigen/teichoic acid export membrane protein